MQRWRKSTAKADALAMAADSTHNTLTKDNCDRNVVLAQSLNYSVEEAAAVLSQQVTPSNMADVDVIRARRPCRKSKKLSSEEGAKPRSVIIDGSNVTVT